MCVGVPMQVASLDAGNNAICVDDSSATGHRRVVTALLEPLPRPGDWLLVHIDVAVRAIEPAEAKEITDALEAASAAARGLPFEHLLGDLVHREPELPAHLRTSPKGEPQDA